jgi:hypothetical protein
VITRVSDAKTPLSYGEGVATAEPSPTPNPNALKFTLDRTLPEMINVKAGEPSDDPFVTAVLGADGVIAVFATNDFVTVSRADGADWDPIIAAVQAAAAEHL